MLKFHEIVISYEWKCSDKDNKDSDIRLKNAACMNS